MLNAFVGRRFSAIPLLLVTSLSYAQAQTQPSSATVKPALTKSEGLSRQDLMRLRPVLLGDLRPFVERMDSTANPSPADMNDAFLSCKLTPLKLGKLGRVVLVEYDGFSSGPNVPMLNIYMPDGSSYRRIIDEGGFGPSIVPRTGSSVPDLLFGGGGGVCASTINRYRYIHGRYELDACDQEQRSPRVGCQVTTCKDPAHPLPTFPDPTSWIGPPNTPAPYFGGPTLTAKQILTTKP